MFLGRYTIIVICETEEELRVKLVVVNFASVLQL